MTRDRSVPVRKRRGMVMSGSSFSPKGKKHQHFNAARDWLDRAESQIESGMDIMAASTLMLAQAELKIMVESIALSQVTEAQPKPRPSAIPRVSRALLAGAAVAACLVFGMAIGRLTVPTVDMAPVQLTQAGAILPDSPQIPVADEESAGLIPVVDESIPIVDAPDREAVAGMAFPATDDETIDTGIEPYGPPLTVSSPPPPREPYYSPVTESQPAEIPSPVASTLPLTPEKPQAEGSQPEEILPPEPVLSSAEVALWTILALSDRLNGVMN